MCYEINNGKVLKIKKGNKMKKRILLALVGLIGLAFLATGCGFPKMVTIDKRGAINPLLKSLNVVVERPFNLEGVVTPEVIKRVESLFSEKLAEKTSWLMPAPKLPFM